MRTLTTLLAATLFLSSGSALAAKIAHADERQAAAATTSTAFLASEPKVCLDQTPATGSRIYTHECRTKSEWAKRGVDIDELRKQQ